MNIVFIGPFGWRPKTTMRTRALWLAKALVARGHAVTILIPPWDDPERAGQVWEDEGVWVINVHLPAGVPLLFHLLLTRTLVRQALALQPEVIHFFKPKAYAGLAHWAMWWQRRLRGEPHTGETQAAEDEIIFGPSSVVRRSSYVQPRKVKLVLDSDDWEQAWNEISPYSAVQKRFFTRQEQWGLRHADAITVASRELEGLVKSYAGQTPMAYVPNGYYAGINSGLLNREAGLDFERIAAIRHKWQLGDSPIVLLYSRFLEFRLERIVNLVKIVAEAVPEARWLMVGQGLQGEEKKLAAKLQQFGLAEYARFTGWAPLAEVPAYFQTADLAVYPYDDTLINRAKCSVKLIDLLAAGLPVVADAVGQNCEYIQSDVSGILTPPEDDAAFGQAVVQLLQAPEQRRKMGQAAAQNIREHFNWATLAQIVEEVYL